MPALRTYASGLALACLASLAPHPARANVLFEGTIIPIAQGQRFIVSIDATNIQPPGLAAFQFEILFDPQHIAIHDPNTGSAFVFPFAPLGASAFCESARGVGPGLCPDPDWLLDSTGRMPAGTDDIDNANGNALIAYGTSGEEALPVGSGSLAVVEIERLSSAATLISLDGVVLADDAEPPMEFSGVLDVSLIPEPGGGVLGGVVVLVLAGLVLREPKP